MNIEKHDRAAWHLILIRRAKNRKRVIRKRYTPSFHLIIKKQRVDIIKQQAIKRELHV